MSSSGDAAEPILRQVGRDDRSQPALIRAGRLSTDWNDLPRLAALNSIAMVCGSVSLVHFRIDTHGLVDKCDYDPLAAPSEDEAQAEDAHEDQRSDPGDSDPENASQRDVRDVEDSPAHANDFFGGKDDQDPCRFLC